MYVYSVGHTATMPRPGADVLQLLPGRIPVQRWRMYDVQLRGTAAENVGFKSSSEVSWTNANVCKSLSRRLQIQAGWMHDVRVCWRVAGQLHGNCTSCSVVGVTIFVEFRLETWRSWGIRQRSGKRPKIGEWSGNLCGQEIWLRRLNRITYLYFVRTVIHFPYVFFAENLA